MHTHSYLWPIVHLQITIIESHILPLRLKPSESVCNNNHQHYYEQYCYYQTLTDLRLLLKQRTIAKWEAILLVGARSHINSTAVRK